MKKVKLCSLVLSSCLVLGALAACGQTEETGAESESAAETSVVETEAVEETAAETVAETEAAETEGITIPADAEFIEFDADMQVYANNYVSTFAEQFMPDFEFIGATQEQLFDFVHIYLKINESDSISYETVGEITYEAFSFGTTNSVIGTYFGYSLSPSGYNTLPEPPEAYGDEPVTGPYAMNKMLMYQAADGESYNRLAIVDSGYINEDGRLVLLFTVYEIDLDTYFAIDMDAVRAYRNLTPDEARADAALTEVATGSAVVSVGQSGEYYLFSYNTNG